MKNNCMNGIKFNLNKINNKKHVVNWLFLITLGFIWGGSFLSVELALTNFKPLTIVLLRVLLAAIILVMISIIFRLKFPNYRNKTDRKILLHCFGMGLFTNALPFSLLTWGQQLVTSSFAGLTMALVPLTILPLSFIFIGEKVTKIKIFGFVLGFFGVLFLIGIENIFYQKINNFFLILSKLACISSTFCYAFGAIITRLCPPVHPIIFASCGLIFASIILLPFVILIEGIPNFSFSIPLLSLLYLAIFPTAFATILLTIIIRNAGLQFLSLVNYQVPLWASILGTTILNETLPKDFIVALILIMIGLFLSQYNKS